MGWFGSIFDAKESKSEELSKEGKDGNYNMISQEHMDKVIIL